MKQLVLHSAIALTAYGLVGCGSDDDDDPMSYEYEVTVVNATAAQPFSPVSLVLHNNDAQLWKLGEAASTELEQIAEGGDNTALIAALSELSTASGAGLIMPGESETVMLMHTGDPVSLLSAVSMPVNTNDAFAGLNGADISGLEVNQSMSWYLPVYDAGTEYNSEDMMTIPGPAAGGEGFNAERDDVMNRISRHPGLVTQADDPDSTLGAEHRISGTTNTPPGFKTRAMDWKVRNGRAKCSNTQLANATSNVSGANGKSSLNATALVRFSRCSRSDNQSGSIPTTCASG